MLVRSYKFIRLNVQILSPVNTFVYKSQLIGKIWYLNDIRHYESVPLSDLPDTQKKSEAMHVTHRFAYK